MSTQTGGGTPHTCKALEHCHTLNERVSDLTAELATLRTLVRSLGEELGQCRKDIIQWHNTLDELEANLKAWTNALARESNADRKRIEALEAALARIESRDAVTAPDCGGCAGQGAHKRWCPEVVGEKAARLGRLAEEADSLGDRIGANDPMAANACYNAASRLSGMAQLARVER